MRRLEPETAPCPTLMSAILHIFGPGISPITMSEILNSASVVRVRTALSPVGHVAYAELLLVTRGAVVHAAAEEPRPTMSSTQ